MAWQSLKMPNELGILNGSWQDQDPVHLLLALIFLSFVSLVFSVLLQPCTGIKRSTGSHPLYTFLFGPLSLLWVFLSFSTAAEGHSLWVMGQEVLATYLSSGRILAPPKGKRKYEQSLRGTSRRHYALGTILIKLFVIVFKHEENMLSSLKSFCKKLYLK